jgi:PBS lyase HEAT-like repeat
VRRRRFIIILAACILVALAIVALWPGPKEPEYNGKKLSEWLKICTDNRAASSYSQSQSLQSAREAVRKIGTNGLPWLVKWISYDLPKWKSALLYSKVYRWMPTPIRNSMVEPILRAQRARIGFDMLGTDASPAIPELVRMTERWPRESSIYAIGAIAGCDAQPDALSALISIATNRFKPLGLRQNAMQAIASLNSVKKYESWVVPAVFPCLAEEKMVAPAIIALRSFRISPDVGVPVMKKAAGSQNVEVRVWAIFSLGRYGSKASPAIPELLQALNDYELRVQQEARDALNLVAPEALTNGVQQF